MILVRLTLSAALMLAACGMQRQVREPSDLPLKTATGGNQVFQIRYPAPLVVCEHQDGENPDVWSPPECMSDIPVCDNSGHAGQVMMCLAYPARELKSELQAAAFAVSRIENLRSAGDCTRKWARVDTSRRRSEKIGGVKFEVGEAEETGNNHMNQATIYRTFHDGTCYELDVNIAIAEDTAFAAEDLPRKLTASEREKIKNTLMQAVARFRFLK